MRVAVHVRRCDLLRTCVLSVAATCLNGAAMKASTNTGDVGAGLKSTVGAAAGPGRPRTRRWTVSPQLQERRQLRANILRSTVYREE